ncbi:MAG: hypothetical protein ABS69_10700 [Nitrosomonadales bacterium SCN 54-20]|nr:MAG: hypothetical protein ABS69_10700 [Nitrosomonadales bacterium SCN 54-20]
MLSGLAAQAALAALIAVISFGSGWKVHSWKSGAKMAELESRDAVVTEANKQCKKDVKAAQAGIKQVTDALAEKEHEAQAAMLSAKEEAKKRSEMARKIKNAPIQEGETQCQAVEREQLEYVEARRDG